MNSEDILSCDEPLYFKKILNWKNLNWAEEDWRKLLHLENVEFPIRKGSFECSDEPHWERKSKVEKMEMSKFLKILFSSDENIYKDNWYYFDYKHIPLWFQNNMDQLDFTWECVGFPHKGPNDSTLWMGTKGAHTPCHIDSYGCNFVAQLYGRKTWLLFSPSETEKLRPTRVPYEESSIYSDYNYFCGCGKFPDVSEAKLITLEPGDVLYVPKKWWHFVQNEESSISINTWIPLESDDDARFEESLVKCFVLSLIKGMPEEDVENVLNPNEEDISSLSLSENLAELNFCVNKIKPTISDSMKTEPLKILSHYSLPSIPRNKLKEQFNFHCSKQNMKPKPSNHLITHRDIINAFCHPQIIKLVAEHLKSKRK